MNRSVLFKFAALVGAMLVGSASLAQEFEKNIMTGGATGTYIQFGRDLAGLGNACGQTLTVNESAGSLANVIAVRDRRNTQFGIVQSDLLKYLKVNSASDRSLARLIDNVVIAAPLYNEEIQVLAKRDIATLADLAGKRVSVGVEDSGTFLTSTLVLGLTNTSVGETIFLNASDSLQALLNDEIDAFFYVAGAPTSLLSNAEIDGAAYHLLPLTEDALAAEYTPTTIPAGTYPFMSGAVDVMAVKAVLMTYDFNRRQNRYHAQSCDAVAEFTHLLTTNLDELKKSGHPKWNNVKLAEIPPGWIIGSCVNEGLAEDYVSTCEPPEVAAEPDANVLYRQRICETLGDC